jgi:hypothetical protein
MTTEDKTPKDLLAEWHRLQVDFQARLTQETFRYLRRLQGAIAPITPGTVLLPEDGTDLTARAEAGGTFEITLDVQNHQRVHSVAAPALDPLVSFSGTTWYPEADFSPEFRLVAPDETVKFVIRVSVPAVLPAGAYTGALSFRGFRQGAFRLSVEVNGVGAAAPPSQSARRTRGATRPQPKGKPRKAKKR